MAVLIPTTSSVFTAGTLRLSSRAWRSGMGPSNLKSKLCGVQTPLLSGKETGASTMTVAGV